MGPAGPGSLAQVINTAWQPERFARMESFFDGVGEGDTSGIWPAAEGRVPDAGA
jgi:chlorophyllide a reductase subunit Y